VSNRVVDVVQIERGDLEVIGVDQTGANEANREGSPYAAGTSIAREW